MERKYAEFAATKACELLAIDSPSGYTRKAADWVKEAFSSLGFDAQLTTKGGVLVNLGGADEKDALLLEAHTDTLGAMVQRSRRTEDSGSRRSAACARKTRRLKMCVFIPEPAESSRARCSCATPRSM